MISTATDAVTISEILNALPEGVVYVRPVLQEGSNGLDEIVDFEIEFSNEFANRLLGFTHERGEGKRLIANELPDANSTKNVFLQYKQVFETGQSHEFDYYHQPLNKHLHVLRKKFKDGVLTFTRDRTQEEIKISRRSVQADFVQSMLNASLHGVVLIKPVYNNQNSIYDFVVMAANSASFNHFGLIAEESIGKLMSNLAPRYKETGFFETYMAALHTKQVQRRELYYEDERIKGWFDIAAAPVDGSVVLTFANITENKNSQRAIEDAAAYLQAVIDVSQTGIFVFTPVYDDAHHLIDFRFRIANRTLAAYVGQEPKAVEGALGSTWFPAYKTNGLFDFYSNTFLTGKTNRFDFHYNADNIDVWLDIMSTKFGDEVLVTFSDYTPSKHLQQQLEASVKELERSNDRLKEFAYVASHDLQEPLRKITTFGNILSERHASSLDADAKRLIDRMQTASVRMQTLINDLLNYSQMNTRAVNLQQVNLNDLVNGVLADLDNAIQENKAIVHIELLPQVEADEAQLRQLFQNLISNALKFKRPESNPEIFLTARQVTGQEAGIVVRNGEQSKVFHEIIISDNGIGFPQQYAEQIFQIFQRLHGRSDYPGTGIGLAIVQKAVENHHGYIFASSEPGKGARFHVLLPTSPVAL